MLRERLTPLRAELPPASGSRTLPFGCGSDAPMSKFVARRGVPATVALFASRGGARRGAEARIWIATDTFPVLAGHPLHRVVYGSAREPDHVDERRCRSLPIRGTVALVEFDDVVVSPGRRRVALEAASQLTGRHADGVARISPRDRVVGSAWRCPKGPLVARRLRVEAPG